MIQTFETWLREGVVETSVMWKGLRTVTPASAREVFVGILAAANLLKKKLPAYPDAGASLIKSPGRRTLHCHPSPSLTNTTRVFAHIQMSFIISLTSQ